VAYWLHDWLDYMIWAHAASRRFESWRTQLVATIRVSDLNSFLSSNKISLLTRDQILQSCDPVQGIMMFLLLLLPCLSHYSDYTLARNLQSGQVWNSRS